MPTKIKMRPISAAQFKQMSPASQRRAIARDVLARLNAKQLAPTTGLWVSIDDDHRETKDGDVEHDLQKVLKMGAPCEVCALGGAICGLAAIEDKIQLTSGGLVGRVHISPSNPRTTEDPRTSRRLLKIFGEAQLAMIEIAYEGGGGYYKASDEKLPDGVSELLPKLLKFHERFDFHDNPERARFRAIWKRVAEHPQGLFTV